MVLFQFHETFPPSIKNKKYVLECRQRLHPRYSMAVEFRHRGWISEKLLADTTQMCTIHKLALVASDDLKHEQEQPDRAQIGLPPGEKAIKLPTVLKLTSSAGAYIRVHRRFGRNRILHTEELKVWRDRASQIVQDATQRNAPIYFLWGTDWEDQPVVNSRAMEAIAPELCSRWSEYMSTQGRNAFLQSFCPKPPMLPPPPRPPAAQVPFIKPFIFDNVQYLTRHTTFEPLWIPFSMSARHAASPDMQQALAPARHVASPPHGCGTRHAPCLFPCSTFSTPVPTPHPPVVPPPAHRGCPPVVPPALCPVAGEHLPTAELPESVQ